MANYPSSIPDFAGQIGGPNDPLSNPNHSEHHQQVADELVAIATELGVDPSGVFDSFKSRVDDISVSDRALFERLTSRYKIFRTFSVQQIFDGINLGADFSAEIVTDEILGIDVVKVTRTSTGGTTFIEYEYDSDVWEGTYYNFALNVVYPFRIERPSSLPGDTNYLGCRGRFIYKDGGSTSSTEADGWTFYGDSSDWMIPVVNNSVIWGNREDGYRIRAQYYIDASPHFQIGDSIYIAPIFITNKFDFPFTVQEISATNGFSARPRLIGNVSSYLRGDSFQASNFYNRSQTTVTSSFLNPANQVDIVYWTPSTASLTVTDIAVWGHHGEDAAAVKIIILKPSVDVTSITYPASYKWKDSAKLNEVNAGEEYIVTVMQWRHIPDRVYCSYIGPFS
jgi:hypothetical protein